MDLGQRAVLERAPRARSRPGPLMLLGSLTSFLLAFSALVSIVNPFSGALIYSQVTAHRTHDERVSLAWQVAFYSSIVMLTGIWLGTPLLGFFGITLCGAAHRRRLRRRRQRLGAAIRARGPRGSQAAASCPSARRRRRCLFPADATLHNGSRNDLGRDRSEPMRPARSRTAYRFSLAYRRRPSASPCSSVASWPCSAKRAHEL
jgi:hypothetical protein